MVFVVTGERKELNIKTEATGSNGGGIEMASELSRVRAHNHLAKHLNEVDHFRLRSRLNIKQSNENCLQTTDYECVSHDQHFVERSGL